MPYHFSDSSSCHEFANIFFLSEDVSNLCSIVYSILLFKLSKSRLLYLQFSRHFNVSFDFTSGVCYLLCILYVPIFFINYNRILWFVTENCIAVKCLAKINVTWWLNNVFTTSAHLDIITQHWLTSSNFFNAQNIPPQLAKN